ncbi:hypothetical protein I350_03357 [Cryptococcus amylolentus CBS 6273]|uniref:RalA-binding protein 1 n=1 Tax=Cryptococcus amylolentus CBS 6273 TaxID=1296118 RepID=A0A1E3K3J0_9TREE|nr:hypothetical protein I350_03357 [Cryptococcus amylolentus CBS 6273]
MSSPASSVPPHLNPPLISSNLSPTSRSRPSPTGSPQQSASPRTSPRGGTSGMIDIEGLLRVNRGDCRKALEVVVSDRNNLQAQNSQLWKLIERQRSQCASLASDNDRLRQDRERANHKLVSAGLDPEGYVRKINTSSSATGLGGLANESPKIRRNHSDREDVVRLEKTVKDKESEGQRNKEGGRDLSAPPETQQSSGLLPSPIPDRRAKRESRMAFPPEVSSYMALVDSPKEGKHNTSTQPTYSSADPSPQVVAPQAVASAESEGHEDCGIVPPPSSKAFAATMAAEPSQPSPKPIVPPVVTRGNSAEFVATRPTPSRETSASSVKSPAESIRSEMIASSISESMQSSASIDKLSRPSLDSMVSAESSNHKTPRQSIDHTPQAHHQQKSAQQEAPSSAPRLSPALLPHARITIPSSTVFPNTSGRDVLCFIVEIVIRAPNAQPVTWNVAKLFSAFLDLDTRIKVSSKKNRKEWKQMIMPLPEGRSWKDFAPSKIDQRKAALEAYLQSLLVAPISDKADLCHFLSTDPVQAKRHDFKKEGYLTKKGKTLGGWKTRYFVLDGPVMEYFESRGGNHLGSITITNAQIGRQNRPIDSSDERDFRHAFLVIEAGKKGTSHRHVLCAESDVERDRWIEILVKHVDPEPAPAPASAPDPVFQPQQPHQPPSQHAPASVTPPQAPAQPQQQGQQLRRKASQLRKHSKDGVVITNAQPLSGFANNAKFAGAPSPSLFNSMETQRALTQSPVSSAPTQTFPVPHVHAARDQASVSQPSRSNSSQEPLQQQKSTEKAFSASAPPSETITSGPIVTEPTSKASKRQSMMPGKAPGFLTTPSQQSLGAPAPSPTGEKDRDRKAKSRMFWGFGKTPEKIARPVFAVPLADSLAIASVANLPAIVFRCIEYLEAKKAEDEEGIYRLSGSSAVIKGLKERYDAEGDVNLLAVDEYWDPHAIAGLLKTFLRDLPTSLLTRELHTRFLAVMDLVDSSARISELGRLVSELPPPNYALLRALTAHLILVVQNAGTNKMTLRNIGIVFSPTLGIPAGIFSELISNFGPIFDDEGEALDTRAPVGESNSATAGAGLSAFEDAEETVKRKRNSMLYQAGGADTMLGLTGRQLDSTEEDSSESDDDLGPEEPSDTSVSHSSLPSTSAAASSEPSYPSAAAVRKAKAAARGLAVDTRSNKEDEQAMTAHSVVSGKKPESDALLSPRPRTSGPETQQG